jgi:NADH-quinone oxidoreductase subunit L
MKQLLPMLIYLPIAAFLLSLCFHRTQEKMITNVAIGSIALHVLGVLILIGLWMLGGFNTIDLSYLTVYKTDGFAFVIELFFDKVTAVFALVGGLVTLLAALFSKFYMHRDDGFKRYFSTLLLFYIGYSFAAFSGNFETLFVGWELLGITSFLLIAYYRDRYLPVKNAMKVISLYRVGDVALLLAMWMAHHVFHQNITFAQIADTTFLSQYTGGGLLFVSCMITLAALLKSAQFPFSSWLPRAMEGPTSSSAIFYGAVSVHLGIFLLLRTYDLWHANTTVQIALIVFGVLTTITAGITAKVQSTIKTQIAYASIAQIGIMFIEVALGWHILALLHFAGNAFLRAYQLLVSPSTLGYMIHNQFFEYAPVQYNNQPTLLNRWRNTIYVLGITEWSLDRLHLNIMWQPFKWLGNQLAILRCAVSLFAMCTIIVLGVVSLYLGDVIAGLPIFYAALALACILAAFASRDNPLIAWGLIVFSQLSIALAVSFNGSVPSTQISMYLLPIVTAGIIGAWALKETQAIDGDIGLHRFHGYAQEKAGTSFVFLLSCLALLGLPFTSAFIGIDLLFTYIDTTQYWLISLVTLAFILLEITVLRIYTRVYLGQHKKHTHPIAYRSS